MVEVSPAQLREATDEIAALIQNRLPLQMPPEDKWQAVAHGFLARGGTLLESVTLQVEQGMPGEAQMLLRILFEHVVTFLLDGDRPRDPHYAVAGMGRLPPLPGPQIREEEVRGPTAHAR